MNNFKHTLKQTSMWVAVTAASIAFATPVMAQEEDALHDEIVTIGTRSAKPRSVSDSPVPVDVIASDDFNRMGNTADITDSLKTLIPSYNATPATGDGSAFVRPTSLRGTASDQTLILVNGKRRHRSALVQFFAPATGNGAHAPDVAMIPGIALKSVEVLRDGAAAQYGSDAIAGVINFNLKDSAQGGEATFQYGEFYQGEASYKLAGNVGLPIGDKGFVNLSLEYSDNEALSRGIQRANAQALIDGGVQGVGQDTPFNDAPFVQTWGRPQTSGTRFFMNSGFDISDNAQFYVHGNYAKTDGRYRFFYRNPNHSSLTPLRAQGFTGLQQGFTPFLDGGQEDFSLVGGLKGDTASGWLYDFSVGWGKNELAYFLNNSVNPSLGLDANGNIPQRDFNVGGYEQKEVNINADFSKTITDTVNLAFGAEYREETYTVNQGEGTSYLGAGVSGLKGFGPNDSGVFSRDNFAVYADIEHDITDRFLLQYAVRFEDYSDFGSTFNWKVAGSFAVTDSFNLRGAISTGFRAPTPGQSNVRTTITTFDGVTGLQVDEGLVPPTSPGALEVGGAPLKEEQSNNYSVGFTSDLGANTTLTIDAYQIDVDDRVYRTGDIVVPSTQAAISFYTNALDVRHQGIDVVLSSSFDWMNNLTTDVSFAGSYNTVEVTSQTTVNGITPVSAGTVEDIENNFPNVRFVLGTNTYIGEKWSFMARANYYGKHFDERGRINGVDGNAPSAEIGSVIYIDAELAYDINDNMQFAFGGSNIFNSFVDTIGAGNANRLSVGLQFPRRTAANYEGGSWYGKLKVKF
ncbi:TonB-dependent receptor [hydrothermal vent metagenome]|uniref:TonB-dependent receptor n=1 Tax=hydrothermal vent metagenome TaxID=652676 RepID=A0A3B0RRG4_9ZZZZ